MFQGLVLFEDLRPSSRIFVDGRLMRPRGEFWQNFYAWWLMWTYNPASVRHRTLFSLQRNEFWMTKEKFLSRFGKA